VGYKVKEKNRNGLTVPSFHLNHVGYKAFLRCMYQQG